MPGGIPALVGPTGSGKSALAEALARADDRWQLINADPFQAYCGLDIGTAKPDPARRGLYRLMDTVLPSVALDAMSYAQQMREAIWAVLESGRWPLLVGGSGFYLHTLAHPHDPEPEVSPAQWQQLRERIQADAAGVLAEVNAHTGRNFAVSVNDHYRIEKAWIRAYGSTPDPATKPEAIVLRYYGLWAEGDAYEGALHARLHAMFAAGWAEEARHLAAQYGPEAPALRAIGYRELAAPSHAGTGDLQQSIITATRQYAKRQRTWFRAQAVRWFPASLAESSTKASNGAKGAQNLTLRLIQYTDVCHTALQ